MPAYRRPCRTVRAGNILIGGDAPVSIQSMLNTDPHNAAASIAQAQALEAAGCEIIRATVPDAAGCCHPHGAEEQRGLSHCGGYPL